MGFKVEDDHIRFWGHDAAVFRALELGDGFKLWFTSDRLVQEAKADDPRYVMLKQVIDEFREMQSIPQTVSDHQVFRNLIADPIVYKLTGETMTQWIEGA